MKTIRIKRSRWARGGKNGEAALINIDGNKCCLGFAVCQVSRHISVGDMLRMSAPSEVFKTKSFLTDHLTDGSVKDNHLTDQAIMINDDSDIDDSVRESKLTALFKKHGFKLVFVD